MTDYTKFDSRKLTLAAIVEIEADDYAKRQIKIGRKRSQRKQDKGRGRDKG